MKRKSILAKHNTFSSKRSQAAMEFLMTYGWALIVILIALAGLAYFGVLNVEQFMPEKIDMPPGLVAQKFFMTTEDNVLTIYLANGVGAPITNLQMSMPCQNGSLSNTIASLPEGKTDKIKIYCQMPEGSRLKGNINITYNTREMQKTFSRRFTGFASVYVPKSSCPSQMAGLGTAPNPYQVCNCRDLQNMNLSLTSNYIVIRDIDCKFDTQHPLGTSYNNGSGFKPVGVNTAQFTGNFNGFNHTISNLYINRTTTNYVGLFGDTTQNINYIGLLNVNISGKNMVGGLVGLQEGGVISNVYSAGIVTASGSPVGGLVGYQFNGLINSSYSTGNVIGVGGSTGGLVGYTNGGTVTNTYSTCSIAGTIQMGGLIGSSTGGSISYSYAIGSVINSSTTEIGGLCGNGMSSFSYWNIETSGKSTDGCTATGKTTAEMKIASTYASWNTNIWNIATGNYPTLKNVP